VIDHLRHPPSDREIELVNCYEGANSPCRREGSVGELEIGLSDNIRGEIGALSIVASFDMDASSAEIPNCLYQFSRVASIVRVSAVLRMTDGDRGAA
jgi:hypothetical protein